MSRGIFWSLLSAFLWSTTFVCARYLLARHSVDPMTLAVLRFVIAGMVLLAGGLIWRRKEMTAIRQRDFVQCLALALLGIVGMSVFLFFGQQNTGAINSAVIMQINPVFLVLLGLFIGERITLRAIGGILLSMTGTFMVMNALNMQGFHMTNKNAGDLLILASAACWAIYSVFSKPLVLRLGGYAATTWVMVAGAFELIILWCCWPAPAIWPNDAGIWTAVFYLALFPTALAFFAWYEAMRLIKLSMLNIMQYLSPVFTVLLAWVLLGERLTLWQFAGMAVVVLGIMLVSWRSMPGRP